MEASITRMEECKVRRRMAMETRGMEARADMATKEDTEGHTIRRRRRSTGSSNNTTEATIDRTGHCQMGMGITGARRDGGRGIQAVILLVNS